MPSALENVPSLLTGTIVGAGGRGRVAPRRPKDSPGRPRGVSAYSTGGPGMSGPGPRAYPRGMVDVTATDVVERYTRALADRDFAAARYLLDTPVAMAPVAEWHTVRGGRIARIRAYFDARPFAAPH